MFIFENKPVYLDSKEFVKEVYSCLKSFPPTERYGLIDQLKRASVSVTLNISEGFTRGTKKEFTHFLWISQGSLSEVISGFALARDLKIIDNNTYNAIYRQAESLAKHINRLIYY